MIPRAALLALALAALAGCAAGDGQDAGTAAGADAAAPATAEPGDAAAAPASPGAALPRPGGALPDPQPGAPAGEGAGLREVDPADIRDIYLAFEGKPGGVMSVIFAIDANANANPSDEPALRLSPENGACNPQELSAYRFREGASRVFSIDEARRGVTPDTLPRFLAAAVTEAMLRDGLAAQREETLPQNVCTRKLWEVLVANQRARAQAAGQL
ncbi:hypothetical protein M1105_02480 [Limibaculum sp. FT325]|uniref:hypothetical protein n=1 Tax=Thermohalobaculum sediminis TaxID=2939436 RepID=UPI0020BE7497|nr:hypothetical protein [Limibaculum sediminis]MCL5775866.1 hypothetical protein [Limibaculum sediminis]